MAKFIPYDYHQHAMVVVNFHDQLQLQPPAQRHEGKAEELLQHRVDVYEEARSKKPERWSGATRDWSLSPVVWLNPEKEEELGKVRKAA